MAEGPPGGSASRSTERPRIARAFGVRLASPRAQAVFVGVTTLVVWLNPGILESPILWDHAYYTYLEQSLLRGESIYTTSFMGYPPFGLMFAAGSMWIGEWFDVPTYLAPRYLAVAIGAASAMLLYAVVRRATGSAWAAILAGVVFASFKPLSASALITLEPKVLVLFSSLLACAAVQRRRWWAAGLTSGLGATCWQPALLVPMTLAVVVFWNEREKPWRPLASYCAGGFLAIIPMALYLTLTESWFDFWVRSVLIPASAQLDRVDFGPFRWVEVARTQFSSEWLFFLAAGAGFTWYAVEPKRHRRGSDQTWLNPRMGGVSPLTLAWLAFNGVEFQNRPDMFPWLPFISFWVAWLAHRGAVVSVGLLERLDLGRGRAQAWVQGGFGVLVGATAVYGFSDGASSARGITLAEEVALVRGIVEPAGSEGTVISFSAEAVYALSGRRSPIPLLRLTDDFIRYLDRVEPGKCEGVKKRIERLQPAVVVVQVWRRSGRCERMIPAELVSRGYTGRKERVGHRNWIVLQSDKLASDDRSEQ